MTDDWFEEDCDLSEYEDPPEVLQWHRDCIAKSREYWSRVKPEDFQFDGKSGEEIRKIIAELEAGHS